MRADMDRKTARRYLREAKLPSELKEPRAWRTREDPFEEDWPWVEGLLSTTPELEAKTLFEALQERRPGRYQEGQLRTLQRHVKRWRALHGPEQEVFFPQQHRPGEAAQGELLDTTSDELPQRVSGRGLDPGTFDQLAKERAASADGLDEESFKQQVAKVQEGLEECEATRKLAESRDDVRQELQRLRRVAALEQLHRQSDTRAISRKFGELVREHVTAVVRDRFTRETERLRLDRVTLADATGAKGALRHQPALVGAVQKATVSTVLSEG